MAPAPPAVPPPSPPLDLRRRREPPPKLQQGAAFDSLQDLLAEAGYKETRIVTPSASQMNAAVASAHTQAAQPQQPVCAPPSPPAQPPANPSPHPSPAAAALHPALVAVDSNRVGLSWRLSDWWRSKPAPAPTVAPSDAARPRLHAAYGTAPPPRPLSAAAVLHWTQDRDLESMGGCPARTQHRRPPIPVFDPSPAPPSNSPHGSDVGRKRRSVHQTDLWSPVDGHGQASPPAPAPLDGSPRRASTAHPQAPGDQPRLRHPISRKAPRPASYHPSTLINTSEHRISTPALADDTLFTSSAGQGPTTLPRLRPQRCGSKNNLWRASVVLHDDEHESALVLGGDGSAIETLDDLPASPPAEPVRLGAKSPLMPSVPSSTRSGSRTDQSRIHALLSSSAADPVLSPQEAVALRNSSCLLPMHLRKHHSVEVLRAALANWPPEAPSTTEEPSPTPASGTSAEIEETKAVPRAIEGRQCRPTPPSLVLSSPTSTDPRPLLLEGAEFEPLSVSPAPTRRASFFSLGFGLGAQSPSRGRSASARPAPSSPHRSRSTRGNRRARTPQPDSPSPREHTGRSRSGQSKGNPLGTCTHTGLSAAAAGMLASTRIGGGALAPVAVHGIHTPRPPRGVGARRPKSPALPAPAMTVTHGTGH